ncbi:hypothetical protein JOB18_010589 [Solea senegalensis]|uniref:Uncharacterized protein n=1 Tax=Solea senegalensis TaxID=28829 RepID=A0AAV6T4K7_SOLSE|nr:hypothetical protein JOB18_010589 [Solea senegalensis]
MATSQARAVSHHDENPSLSVDPLNVSPAASSSHLTELSSVSPPPPPPPAPGGDMRNPAAGVALTFWLLVEVRHARHQRTGASEYQVSDCHLMLPCCPRGLCEIRGKFNVHVSEGCRGAVKSSPENQGLAENGRCSITDTV